LKKKLRITTKCGIKLVTERRPDHTLKSYDSTPAHILTSVDNSLKELGIEQIEVLLLHRPDYLMNVEEIAEEFDRLRSSGKVQAFGVSNFTPAQVELLHSHTPLVTHQVEISLMHRNALENGILEQCQRLRIVPTAWSPFGGGAIFSDSQEAQHIRIKAVATKLGEKYNVGVDQVLLAWILKHPSGILPVVGSSKIERIKRAKAALEVRFSHEEWYELLEAAVGEEVP
ncbi:MAG: aldo/keto reductase, partial [Bacteroidota bacterium]